MNTVIAVPTIIAALNPLAVVSPVRLPPPAALEQRTPLSLPGPAMPPIGTVTLSGRGQEPKSQAKPDRIKAVLDEKFDGKKAAKRGPGFDIRPAEWVTLPESDLERELGLP